MKRRILQFLATFALLIATTPTGNPQSAWMTYTNEAHGYSLRVPVGMQVSHRAADGSGITWQTGTVRIQVAGSSNPYHIKPQEYVDRVRRAAGTGLVELRQGSNKTTAGHWIEALYTKDGRRVHQRTAIGPEAIQSVEFSYAYRFRKEKESVGKRVIESFTPGYLGSP